MFIIISNKYQNLVNSKENENDQDISGIFSLKFIQNNNNNQYHEQRQRIELERVAVKAQAIISMHLLLNLVLLSLISLFIVILRWFMNICIYYSDETIRCNWVVYETSAIHWILAGLYCPCEFHLDHDSIDFGTR